MNDTGKSVTLDQITALGKQPYPYRIIVDRIVQQIEQIMLAECANQALLKISHGGNHTYLNIRNNTIKESIHITKEQSSALHDLFQGSRVEKIRQKHTN